MSPEYLQLVDLIRVLPIYYIIIVVLTTILLILVLYMILFQSPKNWVVAKWLFFNSVISSYLFTINYFFWEPVPLYPLGGGFIVGPLRHSSIDYWTLLEIANLIVVNLVGSHIASLLFQLRKIKSIGKTPTRFDKPKVFVSIYAGYVIVSTGMLLILLQFTRQESKIVIDGYTEGNEGFRKMVDDVVANEPTFSGTSVLNNRLMQLYVFLVFSIIILEVLVLFLLNYNLIKFIHNTKSMVTNTTFKMQITLFKAVSIETGFLLFFLKAPYVLAVVCSINLFGIFGSTYVGIIAFTMVPIHAPVSYIVIMYIVKPYRETIRNWLRSPLGTNVSVFQISNRNPSTASRA